MMVLLIKASLIIGVVLLFYKLVIEKESFFATNRVYLILGLLLAFSIPFISIPKLVENQGVVASLIEPETASQSLVTGTKPTTIQLEESVDAIPPKKTF